MKLRFNSKIYPREAIKKTISVYSRIAKFDIVKEGAYWLVDIKKVVPQLKSKIADEFANYVLGVAKKCQLS